MIALTAKRTTSPARLRAPSRSIARARNVVRLFVEARSVGVTHTLDRAVPLSWERCQGDWRHMKAPERRAYLLYLYGECLDCKVEPQGAGSAICRKCRKREETAVRPGGAPS